MLKFLKLFFVFIFLCFAGQSYGSFQIVEIFPNTIDDKNLEYIVIQNTSKKTLSLSGFTLSDKTKDYYIETDEFLVPGAEQKYFRTQTKLILNNSNEEVFLRDRDGEITDSISYEKTIKGEVIFFELKDKIPEIPDILISDEVFISGEVIISDEVQILENDREEVEPQGDIEVIQDEIALEVPEIVFNLQRPSYISQSGSTNIYLCDDSKDECKVNFDLRDSFSSDFPQRDYICKIDFGLGELSGQEERCNPNTVIFPEGEYEVIFQIFHEDDSEVFSENRIFIQNISQNSENINQEIVSDIETKNLSSSSGNLQDQLTENIILPEIILEMQRPTYISLTGTGNIYSCDNLKDECKVNFDLRESFTEDISMNDYNCEIDFGVSGIVFGEEEKCNPNTVIFPKGEFEVTFTIFQKDKPENNIVKIIQVIHPEISKITQKFLNQNTEISNSLGSQASTPRINIGTTNFEVQSGLTGEGYEYYCTKDTCKINLKYTPKYKDEKCFWDFAGGTYSHLKTQYKCNPSYVTLPYGVQELSLKVYDKNYEDNFIIFPFTVYPKNEIEILEIEEKITENLKNTYALGKENNLKLETLEIKLQGKISKNKSFSGSTLTCLGVEKCSVNLLGIVQGYSKELDYVWKLNGEIFSEKLNPSGIWVEGEGSHEIIFQAGDVEQIFTVIIVDEDEKNIVVGNSKENASEKTQKIKFTQNSLALKYDGLRISGLAPAGSIIEIYHQGEKIFGGVADEKGKYRLVSKDFLQGEYIFDTKIILESGEEIFVEKSGEYILTGEKRANWFILKKVSNKKKNSTSSSSSKVPPKLVVKESKIFIPEEIETLSLREKIIFIAGILFLAICMLLHMISKTSKLVFKDVFSIYVEQYSVKHKITLILP